MMQVFLVYFLKFQLKKVRTACFEPTNLQLNRSYHFSEFVLLLSIHVGK